MQRAVLAQLIQRGLSLSEIAEVIERRPSTVSYWLRKHDLRPENREKYARKGGLGYQELERLVEAQSTLSQMAQELDVSISTVKYWLAKHEIRRPQPVVRRSAEALAARRAGLRTADLVCRTHGRTEFIRESRGYFRCKKCRSARVAARRRRVKEIVVQEAGGRCRLCGYDRCIGALEFHHVDRADKTFALSRGGVTRSIASIREEAGKCVLLCANCHAEVEAGIAAPASGP